jgi:hypothetical protein
MAMPMASQPVKLKIQLVGRELGQTQATQNHYPRQGAIKPGATKPENRHNLL